MKTITVTQDPADVDQIQKRYTVQSLTNTTMYSIGDTVTETSICYLIDKNGFTVEIIGKTRDH